MYFARTVSVSVSLITLFLTFDPGLGDGPWNQDTELTPCQASALVKEVQAGFGNVIPTFNPDIFGIQFKSGLTIKSADPALVQFFVNYYSLTSKTINDLEGRNTRGRNAMLLTFNKKYLTFLDNYGVPLSCLSFYAGKSSFSGVMAVQDLAIKLDKNFGGKENSAGREQNSQGLKSFGIQVPDIVNAMGLSTGAFVPTTSAGRSGALSPACHPLFLKLEDGSMLTNLPALAVPPDSIKIPGFGQAVTTDKVNLTFLLGQFVSTGIYCLEQNTLRANFSLTVYKWMETKLLPALMTSSTCYNGFPAILVFAKSLQMSAEAMNVRSSITEDVISKWRYSDGRTQDVLNRRRLPEIPEEAAQFGPPPVYQNTYYVQPPEPPPAAELIGGEYAPLQDLQPEIVQNEVYKFSPQLKIQVDEESTTLRNAPVSGPLMAGVSITAFLLIVCICCLIPLLCFYCLKPKAFKRNQGKVKRWFQNCCEEEVTASADEKKPFIRPEKPNKGKCATKVNIKVNDRAVAEVSFNETSGSDAEESASIDDQQDQVNDYSGGQISESGFDRHRPIESKVTKIKTKERRASDQRQPIAASGLRTKRHSLPVPTASDFRPPQRKTFREEKRDLPSLHAVQGGQGQVHYAAVDTSSDDLERQRRDRNYRRRGDQTRKTSQEEFYENQMSRW